eukprot:Em0004g540a
MISLYIDFAAGSAAAVIEQHKLNENSKIFNELGAGLSISHLEVGSGWGQESSRTRQADILVTNWDNGISAAFEVTVASPLNSSTITEAGMYSEALKAFSQVATRLAIRGNTSKSMALTDLFGRLSHSLIRANARAILSRSYSHLMQQVDEL